MIHRAPQPDKRTLDSVVDQLIAQRIGRGEISSHLRRLAHKVSEPGQGHRCAMDFRQKWAKFETKTFRSVSDN